MPEMHVVTEFLMDLTPEQMDTLSWGHVPLEMEDKWFSYMEDGSLHIHRSWTGFCIYIVEFSRDGRHRVTINRDPDEYTNADLDKETPPGHSATDLASKPEIIQNLMNPRDLSRGGKMVGFITRWRQSRSRSRESRC